MGTAAMRATGKEYGEFDGLSLKAKNNTQGVAAYKKHDTYMEIKYLATAPWNFPTSQDPRKVGGVGSRMMAELFEIALEDDNIEETILVTSDKASKFYEKVGFKSTPKQPYTYRIDREGMQTFLRRLDENE
jgi:N-acetylglutamate synthase-like GNAT family acetyltransferase